jgi:polysaccharide biosynthesis transport protein
LSSNDTRPNQSTLALVPRQETALSTFVRGESAVELDDSLHLRDLLRIVWKRKWWIVTIATIGAALSTYKTLQETPIYRATTTLNIERSIQRVVDYKDGTGAEQGVYDDGSYLNTQVELLRSRALAERVMEMMRLDIERKATPRAAEKSAETAEPERNDFLGKLIATWRKRSEPSIKDMAVLDREGVLGSLRGSMSVEPVSGSRLVRINVDHSDPSLAARIANVWAESYITTNLERRVEATSYAKTFLEQQIAQTKGKLEDSERQLNQYTREKQLLVADEKSGAGSNNNYAAFSGALATAEQERIKAEVAYEEMKKNLAAMPREILENKTVLVLKEAKAKVEAEYADNLRIYKPGFPKMQQLQAQIDDIEKRIQQEIKIVSASLLDTARSSMEAARSAEVQLRSRTENAKRTILDAQDQGIRYNILKREVDTNREIYAALLQRFKEVGVAAGVGSNNLSVVDKADVPLFPYRPDINRGMMVGLMLGLMAGLALAFVLEYMDDSIKFPDEVERFTGMALLGVIPQTSTRTSEAKDQATKDPRSALAEAYRSVRTSLQFSTSHGAPRTLTITSCGKNEGKSTTAYSLAVALAQLGKRVLIVDADMRNPTLHKMFNTHHTDGLSNILSSNIDPISVTRTTDFPNVYLITAGPLPPNPAELLAGPNLKKLLDPKSTNFDHIVIDSPPVLGIADPIVLCNATEATVFVVESSRTRKSNVKGAVRRLHQAGVHPLGAVLTKLPGDMLSYRYGSDYYYYGAADQQTPPQPKAARA